MRIKFSSLPYLMVLFSLCLAACSGATPTTPAVGVETIVAATFQAMTPQVTEPAVPTIVPATPAQVYPKGSFVPYSTDNCERLRASFEETLGAPILTESVAFSDRVTGATGTACRIHGTGTGATYSMDVFNTLMSLLPSLGWTEDGVNYAAGGPTGLATGFRKGGALGILSVGWKPSADANCPKDQPIGMCPLTPEQKLYDVTFDVADKVVYNPPAVEQCAAWLAALQPAIPVPLVIETVDFADFEMNSGTACQLRAEGNGLNFANFADTAQAIDAILTPIGWVAVNWADGPTGTGREYTLGNMVAIAFVKWEPSADANCPQDQPIGACNLTPEQMLYTVTITFGQK